MRARPVRALAAGLLPALVAGGCGAPPGALELCAYESGALASGPCLTECESRCALARTAGCATSACEASCERAQGGLTGACLDARHAAWRCVRSRGAVTVRCASGAPLFELLPDACGPERDAESAACAASPDGG